MILLLSLILPICVSSTNYSAMNASILWTGLKVWNHAIIPINTPPTLPYQTIEDVAANSMKGYFDYSNNASSTVRVLLK